MNEASTSFGSRTHSSSASGTDDDEGEEESESSFMQVQSGLVVQTSTNTLSELDSFRNEWKQELQKRNSPRDKLIASFHSDSSNQSATEKQVKELSILSNTDCINSIDSQYAVTEGTLLEQFEYLLLTEEPVLTYFLKENESSKQMHISDLPIEIIVLIMKWVVGSSLDYRALNILACVCRGFYVLSRERSLWKSIAYQIWGISKGTRQLVLNRPHPLFSGVYISRASYVRIGEPEINKHYPPCFLIEYYRYIRFFPPSQPLSGRAVMVTSNEAPDLGIPGLMSHPQLLEGSYEFEFSSHDKIPARVKCVFQSSTVTLPLKQQRRRQPVTYEVKKKNYICDFDCCFNKAKGWHEMKWVRYEIHQHSSVSKDVQVSDFSVTDKKTFPPFSFYPVRGYNLQCDDEPL